ncbi:MAG: histidine phosphatase family protein [Candidatus Nanohaloarchaea archaeon]
MSITFLRHFSTEVDPETPQAEWGLSEEGRKQQQEFVENNDFEHDVVYSSPEKKALETAQKISEKEDVPLIVSSDLKEVDRSEEGFIEEHEEYVEMVKEFLNGSPGFAWEEFEEVRLRLKSFAETVEDEKDVLAVTHGMILSTFLPELFGRDRFEFWQGLEFGETFEVAPADVHEVVK